MVQWLTRNRELRTIFAYNWADFGTPPSKSTFGMQVRAFSLVHPCMLLSRLIFHRKELKGRWHVRGFVALAVAGAVAGP